MEDMNTTETRDQNYQNPLNLLKDNAFVTAILILCFIAILEIIIGFFYSTYCSYPTMMHSDVNRRRVQYCAMAGGLGQYEQTIYDQTIKSPEVTVRSVKKEDVKIDIEETQTYSIPIEVVVPASPTLPTLRVRRNSVDIQSVLSSILSDNEDGMSITSNDDSVFNEDDTGEFLFDKSQGDKSSRSSVKLLQHLRLKTQDSTNSGSRDRGKKVEMVTKKNEYTPV